MFDSIPITPLTSSYGITVYELGDGSTDHGGEWENWDYVRVFITEGKHILAFNPSRFEEAIMQAYVIGRMEERDLQEAAAVKEDCTHSSVPEKREDSEVYPSY